MRNRNSITQEQAKELFEFHPDGYLIWKNPLGYKTKAGAIAGTVRKNGYAAVQINKKLFLVHRVIFLIEHGYLPSQIDHIDGNPSNNKIENLREASQSQNMMNRRASRKCISGYRGVCWVAKLNKWLAYIAKEHGRTPIGYYVDKHEAAKAYNKAALEKYGSFARLNTIEGT